MKIDDTETALLDLLGGWLEMAESCRDAGRLPRDEFEADFFGDVVPETYDDWRSHYTDEYVAAIEELNRRAPLLVLGEAEEEPELSPAEFIAQFVLPLFASAEDGAERG